MNYQTIGAAIANAPHGGSSEPEYLTFTNVHETETARISMNTNPLGSETPHEPVIYWSKTKDNFVRWDYSAIELLPGESVYMYGDNQDGVNYMKPEEELFKVASFLINGGAVAASGNIQTLRDINAKKIAPLPETVGDFLALFGCFDEQSVSSLISAPELPATTLATQCYTNMFTMCTSLTSAPKLPATNLAEGCYYCMFVGCTSLTTAPDLPATTLAESCYCEMFAGCASLVSAPELPATTLAETCYGDMFYGCASLIAAPELPATTLEIGCYAGMFEGCSSLTTAPELPATVLADLCYQSMFGGCSSLTTAPELPATELTEDSYTCIFNNCANLASVHVAFTEWPEDGIEDWLANVAESGIFIKPAALPEQRGENYIPEGWTIVNE